MYDVDTNYVQQATLTIEFPAEHVCCEACQLLALSKIPKCTITGIPITDLKTINFRCPLEFEKGGYITLEEANLRRREKLIEHLRKDT